MEIRYPAHPDAFKTYTTDRLREEYLIEKLFEPGQINLVYSHVDRIITGCHNTGQIQGPHLPLHFDQRSWPGGVGAYSCDAGCRLFWNQALWRHDRHFSIGIDGRCGGWADDSRF